MGEQSVRSVVLELFGDGGDASILDYICGVLEDEHFEWEDVYDSIGPFLVRTWGHEAHGPCIAPMRRPHACKRGAAPGSHAHTHALHDSRYGSRSASGRHTSCACGLQHLLHAQYAPTTSCVSVP
jgi:hypothetical protein